MNPIRILQVVPNMQAGGLENFIMNVYRQIDRDKVQFDFLVHYQRKCFFDDEIEQLGGRIYRLSVREDNNVLKYIRDLNRFFREHPEYRIVHGHMASLARFYLGAARKRGVPVRIVHSHNTSTEKNLKGFCKRQLLRFAKGEANVRFACSRGAGTFLFGSTAYTVVPNAIDTERFRFNAEVREQTRRQLGVENKFVVGHIGRFNTQKNHMFLLDIFREVLKRNPASVLLLIGKGETEGAVREKTASLGLRDAVRFLGVRADVERLYQAMDVFALPSLFEGLGIVAVEAQAAGLSTFVSDKIPNEAKVTDLLHFIPLDAAPAQWAEKILSADTAAGRQGTPRSLEGTPYDIRLLAKRLQDFYLKADREGV